MTVSYDGLWELMIKKGMKKQRLVDELGLSSSTVAKMGKGQPVSPRILDKLSQYLECKVNDIIKYE